MWFALWIACDGMPDETSLIDGVQVVTVLLDPPEVAPGASTDATLLVARPAGDPADVLLWSCTNLGDGCLEAALPPSQWLEAWSTAGTHTRAFAAPEALAAVVTDSVALPVSLWALACDPGVCGVVDEARAAIDAGAVPASLAKDLADPFGLIGALPIEAVSLARRSLSVSANPTPNENPVIDLAPPEADYAVVARGAEVSLTWTVTDETDVVADALTTAGAMSNATWDDHEVTVTWFAPDAPGDATLYLVLEDGSGGAALWTASARVE